MFCGKTGKLGFSKQVRVVEVAAQVTPESKTKSILLEAMKSICRVLTWTTDSQEDFSDWFLPTLETKLQQEDNKIT